MDPFLTLVRPKSIDEASVALWEALAEHGFGVLAVHDLGNTLRSKGLPFPEQCRIFELCNSQQAAEVLSTTMAFDMALPYRISFYTEAGQTRLGVIRHEAILATPSDDPSLSEVARAVRP
ncbi:DUF302 domain-containing protein [Cyanobium gracile UHCC 0139]|jgi:uncharacterized protein (DUF302 family)|uniref:DUF302 domain-containing protein n=1 Tax=Cyanobium gracile UHCC 0139 TaxID=3110308 RepID=A0ABU5RV83_9CYAN|nr:DUF302 domain-containing protein [Cyanobium gracile]MEA5391710.1 DUF302 domain-containing protein [Cyanobium gracile UHCC 0139]